MHGVADQADDVQPWPLLGTVHPGIQPVPIVVAALRNHAAMSALGKGALREMLWLYPGCDVERFCLPPSQHDPLITPGEKEVG
jgi:hypothetical protein